MYYSIRNQFLSLLILTAPGTLMCSNQPTILKLTLNNTHSLILRNDLNRAILVDNTHLSPNEKRELAATKSDFITRITGGLSLLLNVGTKSRKIEITDEGKKYLLLVKYRGIQPECHVRPARISQLLQGCKEEALLYY